MYSARERTPDHEGSFQALRKHDEYYLPGGDLFFLIEQNHFRVHRYFFERESPYFKAKLATPASPGASRQGTSESTAIVLNDIKAADFAKFLWVFYNPKYSLYHAQVEDWVSILDLAHRWGFSEIQALVVREIEKLYMTDIRRVVVYHKYDIDRRLLLANYAALVAREAPLSLQEGMDLGMDTTLKIFRAREIARSTPDSTGLRSPRPVALPHGEMRSLVKELFEITLEEGEGEEVIHTPVEETKPVQPQSQIQQAAQVQAEALAANKPTVHTNGVNGSKTNGNANDNANSNANAPNGTAAGKDAAGVATNGTPLPKGNANNAMKNGTAESTTPKMGAGAGAANADAKPNANGTPNGAKDSTNTTANTTATSNATTTPTVTSPSSGDPLFSRVNGLGNGAADTKKADAQTDDKKSDVANKDNKDKETKDQEEPAPRSETPTGKGGKPKGGAKKGGMWGNNF